MSESARFFAPSSLFSTVTGKVQHHFVEADDNREITTTNPKDLMGDLKASMDAVPAVATLEEGLAMMDGEMKYGFRNWREKEVRARVYINAALRHLLSWSEGEERAGDSKVHHLGHARACLGILLDAQATSTLVDDRSKTGDLLSRRMAAASKWVEWRRQYHKVSKLRKEMYVDHIELNNYDEAVSKLEELEKQLDGVLAETSS